MKSFLALSAALLAAAANSQVWNEVGDAPELPPGQMTVGNGPLNTISGTNLDNDVDMFCIHIDQATFSASTVGGATWDTTLWLFTMAGVGVVMSDDAASTLQSRISNAFVPSSGDYLLAIGQFGRDARDAANNSLFLNYGYPEAAASNTNPLDHWSGNTPAGGAYRIALTGASYCTPVPEPATIAAVGLGLAVLGLRRRK